MLNHHQICCENNCENLAFKKLDKCALHCDKGEYTVDKDSGLLDEFYKLLMEYIVSQKNNEVNTSSQLKNIEEEFKKIINNNARNAEIKFTNIHFPKWNSEDNVNFIKLLDYFQSIIFNNCHIYSNSICTNLFYELRSEKILRKYYFENCSFYNNFTIYPFGYWENDSKSLFKNCNFKSKLEIKKNNKLDSFDSSIFFGGTFDKEVSLIDITLNNNIFHQENNNLPDIKDIFCIKNCNFEKKVTLNKLEIKKILIENSVFKDKLEIKESLFDTFEFKNSNVSKVFDAFGSTFLHFKMEKTIFEDFAGFEQVKFGTENNKELMSEFTYVTFKSFSNFREAVFFSGLDLSRTNLKEQPNFFQVKILGENTNRETFRIIKNSFDKNGNHIVANDYFIMEMKAYRKELEKELKKDINVKDKLNVIKSEFLKIKNLDKIKNFILILKKILSEIYNNNKIYKKIVIDLNDEISGFGDNYIRPIRILTLSIILYNLCFLMQKYYAFDESDGIIFCIIDFLNQSSKSFLIFSNFLKDRQGIEFISLLFYIWFSVLIWQIVVAIKRHTIR